MWLLCKWRYYISDQVHFHYMPSVCKKNTKNITQDMKYRNRTSIRISFCVTVSSHEIWVFFSETLISDTEHMNEYMNFYFWRISCMSSESIPLSSQHLWNKVGHEELLKHKAVSAHWNSLEESHHSSSNLQGPVQKYFLHTITLSNTFWKLSWHCIHSERKQMKLVDVTVRSSRNNEFNQECFHN
jgi:hypothetical protein